ncbi:hypothetical protein [Salinarimonas soli]|uniref:Uncharacterized protein n=1 Tax=Salinarimonas soli TaxID=1638099 RepID=A0A5B2VD61_9HYPH|nr:hypothetical protein [Salinarimonas soli]KAA2236269.1 hypothetical protein F0L46_16320 [Salinarimonas soli]
MPADPTAVPVVLAGHATTSDGHRGVLGFDHPERGRLVLAMPIEQASALAAAGVAMSAEARQILGEAGPVPPTFEIERWSMAPGDDDMTVLTFHLAGGGALRLLVTPQTLQEPASTAIDATSRS